MFQFKLLLPSLPKKCLNKNKIYLQRLLELLERCLHTIVNKVPRVEVPNLGVENLRENVHDLLLHKGHLQRRQSVQVVSLSCLSLSILKDNRNFQWKLKETTDEPVAVCTIPVDRPVGMTRVVPLGSVQRHVVRLPIPNNYFKN